MDLNWWPSGVDGEVLLYWIQDLPWPAFLLPGINSIFSLACAKFLTSLLYEPKFSVTLVRLRIDEPWFFPSCFGDLGSECCAEHKAHLENTYKMSSEHKSLHNWSAYYAHGDNWLMQLQVTNAHSDSHEHSFATMSCYFFLELHFLAPKTLPTHRIVSGWWTSFIGSSSYK